MVRSMKSFLKSGSLRATSLTEGETHMSIAEVMQALRTNPVFNPEKFVAQDYVGRREAIMSFVEDTHELDTEKHNQNHWMRIDPKKGFIPPNPELSCGTAGCFAGWAGLAYGATPVVLQEDIEWGIANDIDSIAIFDLIMPNGTEREISEAAAEILGLDDVQACRLFEGRNSVEDLREMVDRLAVNPSDQLDDYRPSWMPGTNTFGTWDY
jgi:hypothetical protein